MLVERLRAQWRAREQSRDIREAPVFETDGLVLGAGTLLTNAGDGRPAEELADGDTRLDALLSVAYGRRIDPHALGHVKAAATRWRQGDQARASLHLALSRLGRLSRPDDAAKRLFMADGLMSAGIAPEAILKALEDQTAPAAAVWKYNANQTRVPAGSGRASGEWASTGGGGRAAATGAAHLAARTGHPQPPVKAPASRPPAAPSGKAPPAPWSAATVASHAVVQTNAGVAAGAAALARPTAGLNLAGLGTRALAGLVEFVSTAVESGAVGAALTAAGTVAAFGILFVPSRGPKGQWVKVGGAGDLSYYWNPDESRVLFRFRGTDGKLQTVAASPGPDGNYRGPDGKVIARALKAAGKIGLVVSTGELLGFDHDDPKLCPKPVQENHGVRGRIYEDFNKIEFNPGNPTPSGFGYRLRGPGIKPNPTYDDCQQLTGALADYKGPMYAKLLFGNENVSKSVLKKMQKQADDEDTAKGARSLTWRFEEKAAADFMRDYFHIHNPDIDVEWRAMPGDRR